MRLPYMPKISTYKIDWKINWPYPEGDFSIIESKGYFLPEDQPKMIQVKNQYPNLDIRMLFQNPRLKIRPGNKITYEEWAEKYGFPCVTIEDLIDEWNTRYKAKLKHDRKRNTGATTKRSTSSTSKGTRKA